MKKTLIILAFLALLPAAAMATDHPTDINGDGYVDQADVDLLLYDMKNDGALSRSASPSDLNGDGEVDLKDMRIMRQAIRCCGDQG